MLSISYHNQSAGNGHLETVKCLVKAGANLEATSQVVLRGEALSLILSLRISGAWQPERWRAHGAALGFLSRPRQGGEVPAQVRRAGGRDHKKRVDCLAQRQQERAQPGHPSSR